MALSNRQRRAARRMAARDAAWAGRPPPLSVRGRVRLGTRVLLLLGALLVTVPLFYLWRLLRRPSLWSRVFLGWAGRIAGARVRRVGTPLRRDVFYVSNHVSWIDILILGGASGTAFVAKSEIRDAPVVGWLSTLNRTVFVSREDRLGVADQINRLRDALAGNWAVTVFPEGTTSDSRSLGAFRTPLLQVLDPPPLGVMVQPVLLDYGRAGEEIAWAGLESGKDNAVRVLSRRGTFPVDIVFLDPFFPADFPGRKAIGSEARRRIAAALEARLGRPVEAFVGHDALAARHGVQPPDAIG